MKLLKRWISRQRIVGLVWSARSRELMFLKDCVSVIYFSNTMQCEKSNGGDRVLWGKVRKPLQSVQTNHGQPCSRLWTILSLWPLDIHVDLNTLMINLIGLMIIILGLSWRNLLNNFQPTWQLNKIYSFAVGKIGFSQKPYNHRAFPPAIYACSDSHCSSFSLWCEFASTFNVLTHFGLQRLMLQVYLTTSK